MSKQNERRIEGIYGILPADLDDETMLAMAAAALRGGIKTLQLRDKKQGFKRQMKRAQALRKLTLDHGARLIVNDSLQLAQKSGADGVHLGRGDIGNLTQLRIEAGDDLLIGVTCRGDAAFAKHVVAEGGDYVSFGAVFGSKTKPEVPLLGLPRLAKARQLFPDANIVAIGGITPENIAEVKACGADAAAVISGLFAADDVEARARELVTFWLAR